MAPLASSRRAPNLLRPRGRQSLAALDVASSAGPDKRPGCIQIKRNGNAVCIVFRGAGKFRKHAEQIWARRAL
eukprot:8457193-Pyramimonas_sp.AAC.1